MALSRIVMDQQIIAVVLSRIFQNQDQKIITVALSRILADQKIIVLVILRMTMEKKTITMALFRMKQTRKYKHLQLSTVLGYFFICFKYLLAKNVLYFLSNILGLQ